MNISIDKYMDIEKLHCVMQFLDEINVRYWIDQGTLLGLYRDGKILDWDSDYDIGVIQESIEKNIKIAEFISQHFKSTVYDITCNEIAIFFNKGADYKGRQKDRQCVSITFYFKELDKFIKHYNLLGNYKIFNRVISSVVKVFVKCFYYESKSRINSIKRLKKIKLNYSKSGHIIMRLLSRAKNIIIKLLVLFIILLPKGVKYRIVPVALKYLPRVKISTPEHYFKNIRKILIGGHEYPIPADTEDYLEFKYGADWRVPRQNWNYLVNDGGIEYK